MRVLFLHTNFPGQYRHLVPALAADPANEVVFVTGNPGPAPPGVRVFGCRPHRAPDPAIHLYVRPMERAVLQGQAHFRALRAVRAAGFVPDVVCAHSGFGASLFVKDVFPRAALLGYFEWYYNASSSEASFLGPITEDQALWVRASNAPLLLDLVHADRGVCPTHWQHSQFPGQFQDRLTVLHDGIDTDACTPAPGARLKIPGLDLSHASEIVTYVARGMEPYRGFPQFMRALARLQRRRPRLHAVIVGAERVAYGAQLPPGQSWKIRMAGELDLDPTRTHFTGLVNYRDLVRVFQASTVHVYLTVPFVLSWSLMEAMSAGCLVVASDTEPVREVIEDGVNGLLVPFFDEEAPAERIETAAREPARFNGVRRAARDSILARYRLAELLPRHKALLEQARQAS